MAAGNEGHRAVARALQALEIVAAAERGLTLGELAEHIGAAKSSLHPLLKTLVIRGYLTYDDSRYQSGPTIGTLANPDNPSVVAVARPFMDELLRQFDETVMLGSMVGETLVYLHSVESNQLVRYSPPRVRPPTEYPPSITKLYLADLDDAALRNRLEATIRPELRERLLEEVREARKTGVACNRGDTFPDLSAVAARIRTDRGIVACLAIGGPTRRIDNRWDEITTATKKAATRIGELLNGHR